jgi:predicted nucleic acid-binding protein
LLLERAEMIEPAMMPRVVPDDPDDDKLVAAALAAGTILVTNDAHLMGVAGHEGLRVVRPAELRTKGAD